MDSVQPTRAWRNLMSHAHAIHSLLLAFSKEKINVKALRINGAIIRRIRQALSFNKIVAFEIDTTGPLADMEKVIVVNRQIVDGVRQMYVNVKRHNLSKTYTTLDDLSLESMKKRYTKVNFDNEFLILALDLQLLDQQLKWIDLRRRKQADAKEFNDTLTRLLKECEFREVNLRGLIHVEQSFPQLVASMDKFVLSESKK